MPCREIGPSAVLLQSWLDIDQQLHLVAAWREWAIGPAPMHHPRLGNGRVMSVQVVSLGWHWQPHRYSRTADDVDGAPVKPFPKWLGDLCRHAVGDAYGTSVVARDYAPDVAIANYYSATARLGMHQDTDERSAAPVVSISLGDSCIFRFGNTSNRSRPYTDIELFSGDVFVFGGPSRFVFHGVPKIHPGTAPAILRLTGRLNITTRQTGHEATS